MSFFLCGSFVSFHICSSGEIVKTEQLTKSCSNGVWPVSQLLVFATCSGPHRSKNCDCFSTRITGVVVVVLVVDTSTSPLEFEFEEICCFLNGGDDGDADADLDLGFLCLRRTIEAGAAAGGLVGVAVDRHRFTKDASFSKSVGNKISQ
jgi:hypothetical protein